ncbi:hypothetical protein F2Q69_00061111 [Brassica cretica]|uniref:Uncharacterized protein n=1 Tax=Brassica cretica TaxID=69181 RepID=A0A8S9RB53_BRACR|nr:hypothetical protein F2Q69_00061111 [Brassica cretica]
MVRLGLDSSLFGSKDIESPEVAASDWRRYPRRAKTSSPLSQLSLVSPVSLSTAIENDIQIQASLVSITTLSCLSRVSLTHNSLLSSLSLTTLSCLSRVFSLTTLSCLSRASGFDRWGAIFSCLSRLSPVLSRASVEGDKYMQCGSKEHKGMIIGVSWASSLASDWRRYRCRAKTSFPVSQLSLVSHVSLSTAIENDIQIQASLVSIGGEQSFLVSHDSLMFSPEPLSKAISNRHPLSSLSADLKKIA